jgi:hypothetical protein
MIGMMKTTILMTTGGKMAELTVIYTVQEAVNLALKSGKCFRLLSTRFRDSSVVIEAELIYGPVLSDILRNAAITQYHIKDYSVSHVQNCFEGGFKIVFPNPVFN